MITQEHDSLTLMQQNADRSVIELLLQHHFINQQARDQILTLLYPLPSWGAWAVRIMSILGFTFLIAGTIFFFAYNWANMPDYSKLTSIELGIICCLAGSWAFSLNTLLGQLFLTAASILIGVFMAVFGQIYQTGADACSLFIAWFILIFPWVLISRFAALWFIWLIIVNIAIFLLWAQEIIFEPNSKHYIFSLLILLNIGFLVLREHFSKSLTWLQGKWHRILLSIIILTISMIPIDLLIFSKNWHNTSHTSLVVSAFLGLLTLGYFLYCYRKLYADKWVYALTILSVCVILCSLGFKMIQVAMINNVFKWLGMSLVTLIVFSLGTFILKKLSFAIK